MLDRDWWREGESRPRWIWEGCDVIVPYKGHVTCQKTGSGSKISKCSFFNEKLPGPKVTSGNVGPDRVSRRASHFFSFEKIESRNKKQNNVTDVLLGLPAGRDGPCPTTAVLRRISHSFHRGCRIAGRIERLGRWRVDLGVSGHEAVWACLACL